MRSFGFECAIQKQSRSFSKVTKLISSGWNKGESKDYVSIGELSRIRVVRREGTALAEVSEDDDQTKPPDWKCIHEDAVAQLRRLPMNKMTEATRRRVHTTEPSRGGKGLSDYVQEGIFEVLNNPPWPETHGALLSQVVTNARRLRKACMKRERERERNLELKARTMTMRDLFDVVSTRDECKKFFGRLYDEFEDQPEAKMVLYAVLMKGYDFRETSKIAVELHLSVARVTNIKRQIIRRARVVMFELTAAHSEGGEA